MIISVFITTPAIHNGESAAHCLRTPRLMNLHQMQSTASHCAANFKNIVLFVNQCFFIMDAITVTAYNVFFFPLPALIITHYGFVHTPSSQLTSTASWNQ